LRPAAAVVAASVDRGHPPGGYKYGSAHPRTTNCS
jgi:hypothetical protein